jgi:hypothetical protein
VGFTLGGDKWKQTQLGRQTMDWVCDVWVLNKKALLGLTGQGARFRVRHTTAALSEQGAGGFAHKS